VTLVFASFLSPTLEPFYRATVEYVGARIGVETTFVVGEDYEQFARGEIDAGFICGLPYVRLAPSVYPLAAPVVDEPRYEGRPVYFSDVVVREDHPARTFADLRGSSWCYNEPNSHSGYLTVLHHLARMEETPAFFGRFDAVGFHTTSLRLVADGTYDASAIDSHLLAVERPKGLRVIDTIGPSPIQPVVAAAHVDVTTRRAVVDALVSMSAFAEARVAKYVRVDDAHYDHIRSALATCRFPVPASGYSTHEPED
jgi:phosphonate transport system substrate-binding protein